MLQASAAQLFLHILAMKSYISSSGVPRNFFRGGVSQQIQSRTEGRENRDRGAVPPESGGPPNLQMGETRILIRFLRSIFHGTGNSARLCQNFGIISVGGFEPPKPPSGYASAIYTNILKKYTHTK
jgi:hypothetical protein